MADCVCNTAEAARLEGRTLRWLLTINGVMFIGEAAAGWWAESLGLLADSLDMLADAAVYGIALFAVSHSRALKVRAARLSGLLQIGLGGGIIVEAVRRFSDGTEPAGALMLFTGALALLANLTCLALVARHRDGEIHMRASWIFSTNDVIANLGVIVSGLLVRHFQTPLPDLLIGAAIALIVTRGGWRILSEARNETEAQCRNGLMT
jgi:cation diffusion facilitator family transporter